MRGKGGEIKAKFKEVKRKLFCSVLFRIDYKKSARNWQKQRAH